MKLYEQRSVIIIGVALFNLSRHLNWGKGKHFIVFEKKSKEFIAWHYWKVRKKIIWRILSLRLSESPIQLFGRGVQNSNSDNFAKFTKNTSVLGYLFNIFASWRAATLLKQKLQVGVFLWLQQIFSEWLQKTCVRLHLESLLNWP